MNLEFLRLGVRNFGSFLKPQEFNFSKLEAGAYFVRGENRAKPRLQANGTGKSTFFVNALCWVLTGRTPRGLRSTDIKPWNAEKGKNSKTSVTLHFAIDGEKHKLTRTAPNAIELDGNEVSQEHIDKLTRLSYPVLKQTLLYGQHEPLFFDLPNKDKLALLSEVLDLYKWEIRSQKASERVRQLENKATKLEAQNQGYKNELDNLERLIADTTKASKQWKSEKAERIARLKQQRADLKEEQAELTKKLATATRIAKAAAEKLGSVQGDLHILTERMHKLDNSRIKLVEQQRLLLRQMSEIGVELKELGEADNCPMCGQAITGTDLGKHKKKLKAKFKELEAEEKEIDTAKIEKALAHMREQIIRARASIATHQSDVDSKSREVNQYKRRIDEIQTRRTSLTDQIKERRAETNPHAEQLQKLRSSVEAAEDRLAETEELLRKTNRQIERNKYWIKGFKDVRLFIIDDVLQELELTTNAVLADLGLNDWEVKYDIERETKSGTLQTGLIITILSPQNSKPVKWESWSGGEGQRLRLAGSLALSEVLLNYAGVSIDLEIFDEPTKHMSELGVDDFCELLAARAKELGRRIFLVDHMAIESSTFEDTIMMIKDASGSYIAEGDTYG